jgi:sialate O-acetylesterase
MIRKYLIVLPLILGLSGYAQFWNGKKSAVVLTYDDALNVHLDNAIPLLDSLELRGTFYLSGYFPGCRERLADWRKAATKGHELGNHTLFHPCLGNQPGRQWVKPDYDMSKYTIQRMVDETRMANVLLEAIDGKKKRTFAFTCGDMKIGDSSFINNMKNDFVAARAVRHEMHPITQVDVYNVDCYAINGQTGEQMIQLVKKSIQTNSLLVFLFHGVGGEHALNVSLPAHRQLLLFLKQQEKDVWVAPMIEVAEHIRKYQSKQVNMLTKYP